MKLHVALEGGGRGAPPGLRAATQDGCSSEKNSQKITSCTGDEAIDHVQFLRGGNVQAGASRERDCNSALYASAVANRDRGSARREFVHISASRTAIRVPPTGMLDEHPALRPPKPKLPLPVIDSMLEMVAASGLSSGRALNIGMSEVSPCAFR